MLDHFCFWSRQDNWPFLSIFRASLLLFAFTAFQRSWTGPNNFFSISVPTFAKELHFCFSSNYPKFQFRSIHSFIYLFNKYLWVATTYQAVGSLHTGQVLALMFLMFSGSAAKSLQSHPTLCDPIDCSPPGSSVPGILQARTLEWVAISFSNAWKEKWKWSRSVVSDS